MPRIYIPGTSAGKRVAIDPLNNTVAPVAYIGLFVPNTRQPRLRDAIARRQRQSRWKPYHQRPSRRRRASASRTTSPATARPRCAAASASSTTAWTATRFTTCPARRRSPTRRRSTTPPLRRSRASGNNLVIGPSGPTMWPSDKNVPWDRVQNASIERPAQYRRRHGPRCRLHRELGLQPEPDREHQPDPDRHPRSVQSQERRPHQRQQDAAGHLPAHRVSRAITESTTICLIGHTNYHALTIRCNGASRMVWHGARLTPGPSPWGRPSYTPVVSDNETWNYGRLGNDRRHNLQVNFSYNLPEAGKALHSKIWARSPIKWTLSGIFSVQSGAPFNPGGPNVNGTAPDYTGTPDVGARVNVVGDPMKDVPAGLYFNPAGVRSPGFGLHHHHAGPGQPGRRLRRHVPSARHQPGRHHGASSFRSSANAAASASSSRPTTCSTIRSTTAWARDCSGMPRASRPAFRPASSTARCRRAFWPSAPVSNSKVIGTLPSNRRTELIPAAVRFRERFFVTRTPRRYPPPPSECTSCPLRILPRSSGAPT